MANLLNYQAPRNRKAKTLSGKECDRLTRLAWSNLTTDVEFEKRGIDVQIRGKVGIYLPEYVPIGDLPASLQYFADRQTFAIEVKPTVGDDYPAVLRQMHAGGTRYLFVDSYTGTGATVEQFVDIFANSGKIVIFRDDVDAQYDALKAAESELTVVPF